MLTGISCPEDTAYRDGLPRVRIAILDPVLGTLVDMMRGRRTAVLSGAGMSTESGIPDYRGPTGVLRARKPMTWQEFVGSAAARQRYWARSAAGWERVRDARPNAGHAALARLEERGIVAGLITQNVDGLHAAAGSRRVVELHGSLAEVVCLRCGAVESRRGLQERIRAANPSWTARAVAAAPDGDAALFDADVAGFVVPACTRCGGELKPNVVFFGENVPAPRVASAMALVDEAELLLVVGSSLAVFSGFRFVQRAAGAGTPIAIVNEGTTRGDALAAVRIDGKLGSILPELADALT